MTVLVKKHLLFCGASASGNCSIIKHSQSSWIRIKKLIRDYDLENSSKSNGIVLRSKVECLRVCEGGPILLIWPDGIWYGSITPEKLDIIFKKHIMKGQPVNEWIIRKTPLKSID